MNVCWIISEDSADDLIDPADIKNTAPSWGSWRTWKSYKTDNCVCSDADDAAELTVHTFQKVCNFYVMQSIHSTIGKPPGVKLFGGEFNNDTISNKDDLIALNLAVPQSDIVLMLGFDFSPLLETDDQSREEYYYNVRELMKQNNTTQFVFVEYTHELASWLSELSNVTFDSNTNIQNLLG